MRGPGGRSVWIVRRRVLLQLAKFGLVGVANTGVTFASYALAIRAGVRYVPAGAGAFMLGALNGFVLNRAWTFQHRGRRLVAGRRYAVVQLAGLGANVAMLWAAVHLAELGHLAAEAAATAPVTLLTFTLSRLWVFPGEVTPAAGSTPSPPGSPRHRRPA